VTTLHWRDSRLIGAFQPRNVVASNTAAEVPVAVLAEFVP